MQLTDQGRRVVDDLAQRHGLSADAVTYMLGAVLAGNGSMAQFSHPELGGSGQWMRGGMTMVGDMFNNALKARVDGLCTELSDLLAAQPGLLQQGSFQSQRQGGGGNWSGGSGQAQSQGGGGNWSGGSGQAQAQGGGGSWQGGSGQGQSQGAGQGQFQGGGASLFVPGTMPHDWWPPGLGQASATGAQNQVRYAYFAGAHRLAVEVGGQVWVYDTLDHQIGGFSQQQGGSGSITFTSQYGTVDLSRLPVVMRDGAPVSAASPAAPGSPPGSAPAPASGPAAGSAPAPAAPAADAGASADIYSAIERLGELKTKGLITEDEFAAKKAELLSRL